MKKCSKFSEKVLTNSSGFGKLIERLSDGKFFQGEIFETEEKSLDNELEMW